MLAVNKGLLPISCLRKGEPKEPILFALIAIGTIFLSGLAGLMLNESSIPPKTACISNINGPSQPQYHYLLQDLLTNSQFIAMTQGRCFYFGSGFEIEGPQAHSINLVFDHYSPHVIYPCNSFAAHEIDVRLQASPTYGSNGVTLTGFDVENVGVPNEWHCHDAGAAVVPEMLQAQNDSVEKVTISLRDPSPGLTSLYVTLILPSGNYTAVFAGFSEANPAPAGSLLTQNVTLPLDAMKTWTAYKMVESYSFADGITGSDPLSVELEG
jgi:hypothetical protein